MGVNYHRKDKGNTIEVKGEPYNLKSEGRMSLKEFR